LVLVVLKYPLLHVAGVVASVQVAALAPQDIHVALAVPVAATKK